MSVKEGRPAGPGVELVLAGEEVHVAADAGVHPRLLVLVVLPRPGSLSGVSPGHLQSGAKSKKILGQLVRSSEKFCQILQKLACSHKMFCMPLNLLPALQLVYLVLNTAQNLSPVLLSHPVWSLPRLLQQ